MGTFAGQGMLYPALDPWTGEQVATENSSRTRPAVTDEVRVGTGRHGFSVENHETGEEWGRGSDPVWSFTDAWGRPAIAGETLVIPYYVGAPDGHENDGIYGLDLEDGTEQWHFTHPDVDNVDVWDAHGFVVSGESIYVTGGEQLQVLRPKTEEPEDEEEEDSILDLSVSAPDSIAHGETACFDVTVWNYRDDAIEVTITLEVSDITESSTVEIAAGDSYASFHTVAGSDLCPGNTEWTVTADGEAESGVLTATDE